MDATQDKHERAVCDAFVAWFNRGRYKHFVYDDRPHEAPDLRYVDAEEVLNIEVTDAYYDERDAAMKWKSARNMDNAPRSWKGVNFDQALVANINERIEKKCANDYGKNCILIVNVHPALTTSAEMENLRQNINVPKRNPFVGMYLTGDFPQSNSSPRGYMCWPLGAEAAKSES